MMKVFIDESGDAGLNFGNGSSPYFLLAAICFENKKEEQLAVHKINGLKTRLGYKPDFEFHFRENSKNQRMAFLDVLKGIDFRFSVVVFDKRNMRFQNAKDVIFTCFEELAFQHSNATPIVEMIFDKSIGRRKIPSLRKRMQKATVQTTDDFIKFSQELSNQSNQIQMADYIAGILNRWISQKKDGQLYFEAIRKKMDWIVIK